MRVQQGATVIGKLRTLSWVRRITHHLRRVGREVPGMIPMGAIPAVLRWSGRPVGVYAKTDDYLEQHQNHGWIKQIAAGGTYERVAPVSADNLLPVQFNPPQTVSWDDEKVFYIEKCRFWGYYGGSIVTHDNRLLYDLSPDPWGPRRHAIFSQLKLPPIKRLDGLTAVISTPEAKTNYSHWMVDLLPRIDLLSRAGFRPENVDRYLVNLGTASYCRETLALAGIPPNKIMAVDASSHFLCDAVVTSNLRLGHWQNNMPFWVPAFLESLNTGFAHAKTPAFRMLYLRRHNCRHRRVLNDEVISEALLSLGFDVVDPGTLRVCDQIRLFSEARMVVSSHSSALTNVAFCSEGSNIIEVFSNRYFDSSFWTMASAARRSNYTAMTADGQPYIDPSVPYLVGQREHMHIDLDALLKVIKSIL